MRHDPSFYSQPEWRNFRRRYLAAHPTCAVPGCGHQATHIDHKTARRVSALGDYDGQGLKPLCTSHHSQKTAAVDGGFGNRPTRDYTPTVKGCGADGLPNEPGHHWSRESSKTP